MTELNMAQLAEMGARVRLAELNQERDLILSTFPQLNGGEPPVPAEPDVDVIAPPARPRTMSGRIVRTRKKLSTARRKAISRQMKAYWRRQREEKGQS